MASITLHVFVSSTWLDLQPERNAVQAVLQRMRETKFVGMEYFGSRDETTRRASLDEVDRSHVYLGLFGGRYGSGITEEEYRRARKQGIPCFVYFKEEAAIRLADRESDPSTTARLAALKDELKRAHIIQEFVTPDDLSVRVTADLHRWLFDEYLTPRLEQAAGGALPPVEAEALLGSIKDISDLSPHLLARLRRVGFTIAAGERSLAIGGSADRSTIVPGSGNVMGSITGDGNVVGNYSSSNVIKTATVTSVATLTEFTTLLGQLREAVGTAPLDEKTRKVVQADLESVAAEAGDAQPSAPIIETKLKGIEAMVASAAGIGTATATLAPLIQQAVAWAQELFR